jgi:hypothetical protein
MTHKPGLSSVPGRVARTVAQSSRRRVGVARITLAAASLLPVVPMSHIPLSFL